MGMQQSRSLDATMRIRSIVLSCEDLHFLVISLNSIFTIRVRDGTYDLAFGVVRGRVLVMPMYGHRLMIRPRLWGSARVVGTVMIRHFSSG